MYSRPWEGAEGQWSSSTCHVRPCPCEPTLDAVLAADYPELFILNSQNQQSLTKSGGHLSLILHLKSPAFFSCQLYRTRVVDSMHPEK